MTTRPYKSAKSAYVASAWHYANPRVIAAESGGYWGFGGETLSSQGEVTTWLVGFGRVLVDAAQVKP